MESILPASAYVRYAYMPVRIFAVPLGLGGFFFQLFRQLSPSLIASGDVTGELHPALLEGLAGGLFLAALCWLGFWSGEVFGAVALHRDWLQNGAPPPPGEDWSHWLMARHPRNSWIRTHGKLYAAPGRLAFVAAVNMSDQMVKEKSILRVDVDASTTFRALEPRRGPALVHALGFRYGPRLEVRTGSRTWEFEVPKPDVVAERLREVVLRR